MIVTLFAMRFLDKIRVVLRFSFLYNKFSTLRCFYVLIKAQIWLKRTLRSIRFKKLILASLRIKRTLRSYVRVRSIQIRVSHSQQIFIFLKDCAAQSNYRYRYIIMLYMRKIRFLQRFFKAFILCTRLVIYLFS